MKWRVEGGWGGGLGRGVGEGGGDACVQQNPRDR